jgi:hypothetical protein
MSDALRELLASFVVEVDKAGELAKGNAAIDALKTKLAELQTSFSKVKAPAEQGAKAISDVFARAAQQARKNVEGIAGLSAFGSGRAANTGFGDAFAEAAGRTQQLGPTRETMNAGRAQMRAAEQAAAAYAQTLRGKLKGAVDAVRSGFNGGGQGGGGGPGLIASLATVRNGFLALGAGAAVHAVKGLVDGIGDISEGAARLGVTTDEFQRLSLLARINATDVGTLGAAFRTLANSAVDPTKETADAFARLGVSTRGANGEFKSSQDLFFDVGEALAGVTNETERSQLAQKLLGRSAQALKPIFAQGTEAFQKQRIELLKLNVLGKGTIDNADKASDGWAILSTQLLAASEPLLQLLIPALIKLTEWVTKGVEAGAKWLKNTDLVAVAMTALGGYLALSFLPKLSMLVSLGGGASKVLLGMAGSAAKAAWSFAKLAVPLLILEDFIVFLRGGDSLIGRALDGVFGKGAGAGTLKAIKDMGEAFKDLWKWILGDGGGEKAKALFAEIGQGLRLMVNDALALIPGSGRTAGLQGLEEFERKERGRVAFTRDTRGEADPFISGKFGGPNLIPAPGGAGQYGPPLPPPTVVNANGDRVVQINMGSSATADDVRRVAGAELERDRNATLAYVP